MLVLSPDASQLLRHWTPANQAQLNSADVDLGSTSPALLPDGYAVQGGKDGILRLLQLHRLPGVNATTGGELQTTAGARPDRCLLASRRSGTGSGCSSRRAAGRRRCSFKGGRLHPVWSNRTGGTSPVVAGSLSVRRRVRRLHVYIPTSGREVASLPTGSVHWQSPIVADGRVAIPRATRTTTRPAAHSLIFSRG